MDSYSMAYAQGLAYAWGRNDQVQETAGWLARPGDIVDSVKFAMEWAELVAENKSRPDLGGAFEAFREGRPMAEGRRVWR